MGCWLGLTAFVLFFISDYNDWRLSRRENSYTRQPARRNACAVAMPMPELPPLTTATACSILRILRPPQ